MKIGYTFYQVHFTNLQKLMLTESKYKLAERSQLTSSGAFRHQFPSSYMPSQTDALRTRTSHVLTE